MKIHTFTGQTIDIRSLRTSDILLEDIAHALSQTCRFAGHTRWFYSVAQHSMLVAEKLPDHLKLAGLLHDAAEAYIGDLIAPIKYSLMLPEYERLEDRVLNVIGLRFHVNLTPMHPSIKEADQRACVTELHQLLGVEPDQGGIRPYPYTTIPMLGPRETYQRFMQDFARYC